VIAAERLGGRPVVALTGDLTRARRRAQVRDALAACDVVPQRGVDFAHRLAHAHRDAGSGAVVQIGMDTPQVTAELLVGCADGLADADAVLGPAEDGGWWLLGLRRAADAECLAGVAMSTAHTGTLTEAALAAAGCRVARAPGLRDVDTIADARAVAALAPGTRFAAAVRRLTAGELVTA
jgi:glycosyltransferase A (GT-A) superfamily protein (DUF2064 family)